jgi:hypothetical protein
MTCGDFPMTYTDIEGMAFGQAETPDAGMARAWHAHMAGLQATYQRLTSLQPGPVNGRIDMLLSPNVRNDPKATGNWAIPNEIESLLARLYPPAELEAELDSAFATADRIAVPSRDSLRKRAAAATLPDEKQAVLATLLRDTHNRYAARRSERIARRIVALRMARLGLWLTGLIAVVLLVFGFQPEFEVNGTLHSLNYGDLAKHNTIVCVFFGVLGAYLSRLIAFQNTAASQSFDDLENGYAAHFIFVRLLVGGLCALVLYFLIAGRLLAGELFPEPIIADGEGFGALWKFYDDQGTAYSGPTSNFAKLIVWSFIAGFSERFLPDHLSALETKSRA